MRGVEVKKRRKLQFNVPRVRKLIRIMASGLLGLIGGLKGVFHHSDPLE